jgi:hypothetical protein
MNSTEQYPHDVEISAAMGDELASWRRIVHESSLEADHHKLLRMAATSLWRALEIDRTVHPERFPTTFQVTVDELTELAEFVGIDVDDAQRIITAARNSEPNTTAGPQKQAEALPQTVRLTFFDQLTKAARKPWVIKNVMARGETSSWVAPPAMAKSALLTEVAVHLGGSQDWRGYRIKERCGVVYFAIERADLTKRRLTAHRLRDKLPNLPIAVAGDVIDLMNKSCVDIIVAAIKEAEQHFGLGVGLAIFDTYAKGIAAGGGDEDKAKDQNIALANLRRVLDRVHIHIAGIGHTGKDESRGERGSNARLADVDVSVLISGDTTRTATVMKANDQPEGPLVSFQLEPFEFGPDEDGDPFRTFILSKDIITSVPAKSALTDQQRLALEALAETILASGRDAPTEYGLPHGIKVVTADQWKTELYRRNVLDPEASNPRARFNELRNRLAAKKLIGARDDLIWSAHPQKQP